MAITNTHFSAKAIYTIDPELVQDRIDRTSTRPMFAVQITVDYYSDGESDVYIEGLAPVKDGSRPDKRKQTQMLVLSQDDEDAFLARLGIDRHRTGTLLQTAMTPTGTE